MIIYISITHLGLYMIYEQNYDRRIFMKRDIFTLCNMHIYEGRFLCS